MQREKNLQERVTYNERFSGDGCVWDSRFWDIDVLPRVEAYREENRANAWTIESESAFTAAVLAVLGESHGTTQRRDSLELRRVQSSCASLQ